ncbi:MAG: esterase [Chitinivibrionales bacterium]|nr:esterase [Chitinivibrionales bacterium]
MKLGPVLSISMLIIIGCGIVELDKSDHLIDGYVIEDPWFTDSSYRVSLRTDLTVADREKPVIILVHGYGSSTFQWEEFAEYAENDGRILTSIILLGGHGKNVDEFKKSTWEDWGATILDEYRALVQQGYTHINIATASTGGTLALCHIATGEYDAHPPEHFFLVDPLVIPGDKLLTLVKVVGPMLGNSPRDNLNEKEQQYIFTNRPAETLDELYSLCKLVRSELEDGITLPSGSWMKIFQVKDDPTVDPASSLLIYKGVRTHAGKKIEAEIIDSDKHVFTSLSARSTVSKKDRQLQKKAFNEIAAKMLE